MEEDENYDEDNSSVEDQDAEVLQDDDIPYDYTAQFRNYSDLKEMHEAQGVAA
jgi:hypothetical protein